VPWRRVGETRYSSIHSLITLALDGGVWHASRRGCCSAPSLRESVGPRAGLLHNLGEREFLFPAGIGTVGRPAVALLLYRLNCSACSSALVKCFRMTIRCNYTLWSKATCSILGTKIRAYVLTPHTCLENSESYTHTHTHMYVFRLNSALQKELFAILLIAKSDCYLRHVCPSTWHSRAPNGRIFVKFCIGCILLQYVYWIPFNNLFVTAAGGTQNCRYVLNCWAHRTVGVFWTVGHTDLWVCSELLGTQNFRCVLNCWAHRTVGVFWTVGHTELLVCSELLVIHLTALKTSFSICTKCSTCCVLWRCIQVQQSSIKWEMVRIS
jgi:hypothetical protein